MATGPVPIPRPPKEKPKPEDPNAQNVVVDVDIAEGWRKNPPTINGENFTSPPSGDEKPKEGGTPPPTIVKFRVDTTTIHSAEQSLLKVCEAQITDFENFKAKAVADEDWMFATKKEGDTAASNNKDIKAIIQGQNALLQSTGQLIKLVGDYVGLLNNAGQSYAKADRLSWPQPAD